MSFWKKLFGKKEEDEGTRRWNAMWEAWEAGEIPSPYNELLTYDSEMQEGGHLQFFLNRALRRENAGCEDEVGAAGGLSSGGGSLRPGRG